MMNTSRAADLFSRASRVMPGGVNSPVRAFKGVGGDPVFVRRAQGAYLEDESGRRLVDYIGGYGPQILGHAHPAVVAAVEEAARGGTTFGAPTRAEVELAEVLVSALPAMDMVRLVNSGTEATMAALRLARAATGRALVLKFEGCYHGHGDPFLVAAGSGALTLGVPSSPGVPSAVTQSTLLAPYNDLERVAGIFAEQGDQIAAVFVEPVAGNMGLVPPRPGFLAGLRELCSQSGALLVFDEVMTGFRVAWGGAQVLFDIAPDLTCLAKVIGGGMPIGAYGGRRDLMEQVAPSGPVYQAGTLSGNPVAVAAGLATLEELRDGKVYARLETTAAGLETAIRDAASEAGVPCRVQRQGSMVGLFLTSEAVHTLADVDRCDHAGFRRLFWGLLDAGVHLPPSAYETLFVSAAHGDEELELTAKALRSAFARVAAA